MAIYCVSDIHGQFELFEKMLDKIAFSEKDYLYVLGDAIDRGPDGIKILQRIMSTPNMDLLIGNHENMMLYSIDLDGDIDTLPGRDAFLWLIYNGGQQTFDEYKKISREERRDLIEWLGTRLFTKLIEIKGKQFCLTHSYFNMDRINDNWSQIEYQTTMDITWKSPFHDSEKVPISEYQKYPYQFIIGHVPVQRITESNILQAYHYENVTVIDGGCSFLNTIRDSDNFNVGIICIDLGKIITAVG